MKTRVRQWLASLALVSLFAVSVCLPGTALASSQCIPGYGFQITSHNNYLHTTQPTQALDNDTSSSKTFTFTVTVNTSVTWTFSASFQFDEGIIFAQAKETFGIQYAKSVGTVLTNTASGSVPAWHEDDGNYGVFETTIVGNYIYTFSNCTSHNYGQMTVHLPYKQGWEITQNSN